MKRTPKGWNIRTAKNGVHNVTRGWEASPLHEGEVLGEVAFGGFGFHSSEDAHEAARQILAKFGLLPDEGAAGHASCEPED